MSLNILQTSVNKQYLGFCQQKGYVYSVETSIGQYSIVALKSNVETVIISYTAPITHTGGNDNE